MQFCHFPLRQASQLQPYLGEKLTLSAPTRLPALEKGWGRGDGEGQRVNVTLNTLLIDERRLSTQTWPSSPRIRHTLKESL